jgi:hypothetical protein
MEKVIDPYSGLEVRETDNSLKRLDMEAVQEPALLKLGKDGLPVGWEAPHDDRS